MHNHIYCAHPSGELPRALASQSCAELPKTLLQGINFFRWGSLKGRSRHARASRSIPACMYSVCISRLLQTTSSTRPCHNFGPPALSEEFALTIMTPGATGWGSRREAIRSLDTRARGNCRRAGLADGQTSHFLDILVGFGGAMLTTAPAFYLTAAGSSGGRKPPGGCVG